VRAFTSDEVDLTGFDCAKAVLSERA